MNKRVILELNCFSNVEFSEANECSVLNLILNFASLLKKKNEIYNR